MKLILIEPVDSLGLPGDVVDVKAGFARNYLLPQRKALKATEGNVAELQHQRRLANSRRRKLVQDLNVRAEDMQGAVVEFTELVSQSGRLYGSVTSRRIAAELSEKFQEVPSGWVQLTDPIKEVGEYDVELKLAPEVTTTIQVIVHGDVEATPEELAAEAAGESEEGAEEDAEDVVEQAEEALTEDPEAAAAAAASVTPTEPEAGDEDSDDEPEA